MISLKQKEYYRFHSPSSWKMHEIVSPKVSNLTFLLLLEPISAKKQFRKLTSEDYSSIVLKDCCNLLAPVSSRLKNFNMRWLIKQTLMDGFLPFNSCRENKFHKYLQVIWLRQGLYALLCPLSPHPSTSNGKKKQFLAGWWGGDWCLGLGLLTLHYARRITHVCGLPSFTTVNTCYNHHLDTCTCIAC